MANYFNYLGLGRESLIGPNFFEKYIYNKKLTEGSDGTELYFSLENLPINAAITYYVTNENSKFNLEVQFQPYEKKPGVHYNFNPKILKYDITNYNSVEFDFDIKTKESKILFARSASSGGWVFDEEFWNVDIGFAVGTEGNNYITLNVSEIEQKFSNIKYCKFTIARVSETLFLIYLSREV